MKLIKTTVETRAYTEQEAMDYIERFRADASEKGYTVGPVGYTPKVKKSKGEVISEGWLVKCTKIHEEFWGPEDIA